MTGMTGADRWEKVSIGKEQEFSVFFKGKAEVLQVWDPVWIFFKTLSKPPENRLP